MPATAAPATSANGVVGKVTWDDEAPAANADPAAGLQRPDASRSFLRAAGDIGIGLGEGVVSAGMFVPQLANTLTGGAVDKYAFKPLTGAIDSALGGTGEGNTLAQASQDTRGALDELKSPQLRAKEQELSDTKGFIPTVKNILSNPTTVGLQQVSEQIPQLIAPGGIVRKAGEVAFERVAGAALARGIEKRVATGMGEKAATAAAKGAAEKLGQRAAIKAGTKAAIATEAVQSGSQNSEQAQQQVLGLDQKVFDANPQYQALIAQGVAPQDAKEQLAQSAGLRSGAASALITAATGGLTGKLESKIFQGETGVEGLGQLFTKEGAKELGKAIGKETVQEGLQEGGEQFGSNLGVQTVDPSLSLMDQVPENAALGAVLGGTLGGGSFATSAALSRPHATASSGPLGRAADHAVVSGAAAAAQQAQAQANAPAASKADSAPSAESTRIAPEPAPWSNPDTGEVGNPTPGDIMRGLADHMVAQHQATGDMRINPKQLADAWGITTKQVESAKKSAVTTASDQIAAIERAAMNRPAAADASTTASIPFMITQKMRADLRAQGHSEADISAMTPEQAHAVLNAAGDASATGAADGNERVSSPADAAPAGAGAQAASQADEQLFASDGFGRNAGTQEPVAGVPASVAGERANPDAIDPLTQGTTNAETTQGAAPTTGSEGQATDVGGAAGSSSAGSVDQGIQAATQAQEGAAQTGAPLATAAALESAPPVKAGRTSAATGGGKAATTSNVTAAVGRIAAGESVDTVLKDADQPTVHGVAKALGHTFSKAAPAPKMIQALTQNALGKVREKAAAVIAKPGSATTAESTTAAPVLSSTKPTATQSVASRKAQSLTVKTPEGSMSGRAHVNRLVKAGYDQLTRTPSGSKFTNHLKNAAGESEPIHSRQVAYAEEVIAASKPQPVAANEIARKDDRNHDNENGSPNRVQQLGAHANALPEQEMQRLSELRRKGNHDLPHVDGELSPLHGRHGTEAGSRVLAGQDQHERKLRAGELPVGDTSAAGRESKVLPEVALEGRNADAIGTRSKDRNLAPDNKATRQAKSEHGKGDSARAPDNTSELAVRDVQGGKEKRAGMGEDNRRESANPKGEASTGDANRSSNASVEVHAEKIGERSTALTGAGQDVAKPERRSDIGQRAAIDALPIEQSETEKLRARVADLERERNTSDVTGLRNKRAFDDDAALGWSAVGAADMDGLKRLNDTIGHEAADSVLKALGDHMRELENDGVRFYHRSGDEFSARFKNAAEAEPILRNLQSMLDAVQVSLGSGDTAMTYDGIGLSVGHGETYEQADTAVNADKADRLASGKREQPRESGAPGRLREATAGRVQADQRDVERGGAVSKAGDIAVEATSRVEAAAAEAAAHPENERPDPTPAQLEGDNYAKGHLHLHGLDIAIEIPKGGMRRGVDAKGKAWERELAHHYGAIRGTTSADGENVDVYLGPHAEDASKPVFVIDQLKPNTKTYDESKVMLGYRNGAEARAAYQTNFPANLKTFGAIRKMSLDEFKAWLKDGDTTKPAGDLPATANLPETPDSSVSKKAPAKRGGIATNGAKVRVVGGKIEYVQGARETLEAYFKPDTIVHGYAGTADKVLAFTWNDGTWNVTVQHVNEDGSPLADQRSSDARPRAHSTMPERRELIAKLGKPVLAEKVVKAPVPAGDTPVGALKTEPSEGGNVRMFSIDDNGAAVSGRSAANIAEARAAAMDFIGKPITNENGLVPATVSNKTLAKMLSKSAVEKSTSMADHVRAVANVDALYRNGVLDESYEDKRGEPTIAAIHRVVAPMIGANGEVLAVKMTVKETTGSNSPNPLYTLETLDVAKPALLAPQSGIEPTPGQNRNVGQAGFSTDVTRMLEEFKQRLFRRSTNTDESITSTTEQAAHTARIKSITDDLTKAWKGDDVPRVLVVATPENLPPIAKIDPATGKADPSYKNAAGMYDGRTVWIVASRHPDTEEGRAKIQRTLAHETIGHYGIDRIINRELGDGAWKKTEDAFDRLRNDKTLSSKAMRSVLDSVERRYKQADGSPADKTTFAREALAVMAERGVHNGLLDRAVSAIRRFLRKFFRDLKISEREIRQLMVRSKEFIERGQTQQQKVQSRAALAFSKSHRSAFADAERFARSVKAFEAGTLPTDKPILVTEGTPDVLRKLGAPDLPIEIDPREMNKVLRGPDMGGKHDLGRTVLQQLVRQLHEPVAVFKAYDSAGNLIPQSRVMLTELKDAGGKPVMVAIRMGYAAGRVRINSIRSVYGRPEQQYRNWLSGDRLLYIDKTKTPDWLTAGELQLLKAVQADGSGVSGKKVLTDADIVKPFSSGQGNYSRDDQTDTPAFQNFFGNSAAVDKQGNPLLVYHGTAEEFDTFDPKRSGSATAHMTANLGTFFAEDQSKAKHYAENASQGIPAEERVVDAYLSIQKPYELSMKQFMAIDSQDESAALREKLVGEGYDGIHIPEIGQWVAFNSNQIKSASENRGTFDRNSGNIFYSRDENADPDKPQRARKQIDAASDSFQTMDEQMGEETRNALQRAGDWISGKVQDLKPVALGALQLRHITELAQSVPALAKGAKRYTAIQQKMEAYRHQLETDGAAKVTALQKFAFEKGPAGWFGKLRPQAKQLFQFQNKVTQLGIDPTTEYQRLLMADSRGEMTPWTEEGRKERIKALKNQQRGRSADDKKPMQEEIKELKQLPAREKQREEKYPDLVREWNKLSAEQKEHFVAARDYYSDLAEKMMEANVGQIQASTVLPPQNKLALERRLRDRFAQSQVGGVYFPLARFGDYWLSGTTKDQVDAHGNVTKPGEYFYRRFENAQAQETAERRMRAAGASIDASGRKDGKYEALKAPPGTFVSDVLDMLRKSGAPESALDEVYQTYLKTMPELAMSKHYIHRSNVAGYSDDGVRVFANNVQHGSIQLARATYAHELSNALTQMEESLEAARRGFGQSASHEDFRGFMDALIDRHATDPKGLMDELAKAGGNATISESDIAKYVKQRDAARAEDSNAERMDRKGLADRYQALPLAVREAYAQQAKTMFGGEKPPAEGTSAREIAHADALLAELAKRHDWLMNPTDSKWSSQINALTYLYYIGASPASALVNLIQIPQIVLPVLAARHGWGITTKVLTQSMVEASKTFGHMNKVLKGEDLKAFHALESQGTFQRTQTHMLAGLASGDRLKSNPAWSKVMNAVSIMFQTSEVINRTGTGMAAFRLGRAKGMDFEAALKYADEMTNGTHGDYSNANRSRWMQQDAMKVALQFKSFGVAMGYLWGRNTYQMFKGATAEERSLARRTITGMLGMTGLFAGVMGMPLINVLKYTMQAMHAGFGDDDEPWDFDTEFRRWLADFFGKDAAEWIASGAVNQITGANVASRVGQSDLFFRDDDKQMTNLEAVQNLMASMFGPVGGVGINIARGMDQVNQGHVARGAETMLPTFAKNAMKSFRYATEGVNTLKGAPVIDDVSSPQLFAQLIGFQPTAVEKQYRENNVLYNSKDFVAERRSSLMNAYALARKHGDAEDVSVVTAKISAYNKRWPSQPISIRNLIASQRQSARMLAEAQHGVSINKRLLSQLQQRQAADDSAD